MAQNSLADENLVLSNLTSPPSARRARRLRQNARPIVYIGLAIGGLLTLLPFIWTILASFKTHAEIINPTAQSFFPREFTLQNYITIFSDESMPLARFYFNSTVVALANVITNTITSAVFGYVFAKFHFRFKKAIFSYILVTMMVPFQLTMIPSYLVLLQFNLTDNLLGLIVLSWFNSFGIFLMRQFMSTIPDELIDAARVDGANEWQIFLQIVLPQTGAVLATFGVLVFISNWNAYLWPLIVLRTVDVRTLPIILTWYNDRHVGDLGLQMAASVLIVMPILVVYMFMNRWVVRGFSLSGLKA